MLSSIVDKVKSAWQGSFDAATNTMQWSEKGKPPSELERCRQNADNLDHELTVVRSRLHDLKRQRGELSSQLLQIQKQAQLLCEQEKTYNLEIARLEPLVAKERQREAELRKRHSEVNKKKRQQQVVARKVERDQFFKDHELARRRGKELKEGLAAGKVPGLSELTTDQPMLPTVTVHGPATGKSICDEPKE